VSGSDPGARVNPRSVTIAFQQSSQGPSASCPYSKFACIQSSAAIADRTSRPHQAATTPGGRSETVPAAAGRRRWIRSGSSTSIDISKRRYHATPRQRGDNGHPARSIDGPEQLRAVQVSEAAAFSAIARISPRVGTRRSPKKPATAVHVEHVELTGLALARSVRRIRLLGSPEKRPRSPDRGLDLGWISGCFFVVLFARVQVHDGQLRKRGRPHRTAYALA
jgi:hypothetical protein